MKVSIITPLYNQAEFIERTIKSVIQQDVNVEHIVINDGSTDNADSVVKKYENQIIYIKQKNRGQTPTMNRGLKMATGDIICCLNADDILLPGALKYVIGLFKKKKEIRWLTGDYIIIDKDDHQIEQFATSYKKILRHFPYEWMLSYGNFLAQCGTFWRKDIMTDIGLLDESRFFTMDYDYWFRIIKIYPLYAVHKKLSAFRVHPRSIGGSRYKDQFAEDLSVAKKHINSPFLLSIHRLHLAVITYFYGLMR